jgi:hypothetical protein
MSAVFPFTLNRQQNSTRTRHYKMRSKKKKITGNKQNDINKKNKQNETKTNI